MTRPKSGPGRTTSRAGVDEDGVAIEPSIPSYRERHPIMFAVILLAVAAMAFGTIALPISLLFS